MAFFGPIGHQREFRHASKMVSEKEKQISIKNFRSGVNFKIQGHFGANFKFLVRQGIKYQNDGLDVNFPKKQLRGHQRSPEVKNSDDRLNFLFTRNKLEQRENPRYLDQSSASSEPRGQRTCSTFISSEARGLINLGQPTTSSKARGPRDLDRSISLSKSRGQRNLGQPINSSEARG